MPVKSFSNCEKLNSIGAWEFWITTTSLGDWDFRLHNTAIVVRCRFDLVLKKWIIVKSKVYIPTEQFDEIEDLRLHCEKWISKSFNQAKALEPKCSKNLSSWVGQLRDGNLTPLTFGRDNKRCF